MIKAISETGTEEDDNAVAVCSNSTFTIVIHDKANSTKTSQNVSLDPDAPNYISKVLNTDPFKFGDKKHLLYSHFPVDSAVAEVDSLKAAILRGEGANIDKYGDYSSRFRAPKTTKFISQPLAKHSLTKSKLFSKDP